MRVITVLVAVAGFLSVCGCSRPYQEVYATPTPSLPRHATKVRLVKTPPPSPRILTKTKSVKPPPIRAGKVPPTRSSNPSSGNSGPPVLNPVSSKHYVVRDTVGNCAVLVLSAHLNLLPGNILARPGEDLEIIGDQGGYASSESANNALQDSRGHCTRAEAKFKAAQAKADKLGGVDKLTSEDIEGLSPEQLKRLRGY
jgi:hypothetical protein